MFRGDYQIFRGRYQSNNARCLDEERVLPKCGLRICGIVPGVSIALVVRKFGLNFTGDIVCWTILLVSLLTCFSSLEGILFVVLTGTDSFETLVK